MWREVMLHICTIQLWVTPLFSSNNGHILLSCREHPTLSARTPNKCPSQHPALRTSPFSWHYCMSSYYNKTTIINRVLPWVILTPLTLKPIGQKLGYLGVSWTCSLCLKWEKKCIYRVLTLIEEVQSTYIRIYCVPLTPLPTMEKLTEETAFNSKGYKRRFILEPNMSAYGLGS